jgi:transcriptional regulator with XRE-family HTH domain
MFCENVNRLTMRLNRIAQRKTQADLGKQIGRSQMWVCRVERGRDAVVTEKDFQGLVAALGLDSADLEGKG